MSGENLTSDSQTQQANTCPFDVVIPDDAQPEQEQTAQQVNTCPWDVIIPDDVQPEQEQIAQLNDQQYTESNNNYVDIPQGIQNADNR